MIRASAVLGPDVSRETSEKLEGFVELLRRWNDRINLVAPSTLLDVWTRHIADSAQLLKFAPTNARDWMDLGTGGGFPGLVVAILAAEVRPDLKVVLVEADQRKAAFLREASRVTLTPVTILAQRVESVPSMQVDIVSARALASIEGLLSLAARLVRPDGAILLLKGRSVAEEVASARRKWSFSMEQTPSVGGEGGTVVRIRDVVHA